MTSRIEEEIPGLSVRVLGPPTIEQYPEVAGQRESDQEEFWMLYRRLAKSIPGEAFARFVAAGRASIRPRSGATAEEPPWPPPFLSPR
jgi:hypothetical protein